jgi:F-type H+-transporting ATPase subunit delta
MKDRKLAVRYARALLAAIPDPAVAQTTDRFLTALAREMEQSDRFRDLMLDPAFSNSERRSLLRRLAELSRLPDRVGNFMAMLVDNRRLRSLGSIAQLFHELLEESQGIVPAEIATAMPLEADQQQRAQAVLERLTGRGVRLTCKVDPALIGGAVTRIGSVVYDGSLRTQLAQLRRRMAEE